MHVYQPTPDATVCVIWMHGLGASADDMSGLAQSLALDALPIRHVCLQAPTRPITCFQSSSMPAWYDIRLPDLMQAQDIEGLQHSAISVRQVIDEQIKQGISSRQIFLAGFSQGGALALFTALTADIYLGGIVALSTYLPAMQTIVAAQRLTIPIFMAYGDMDPVVWPQWTKSSVAWLESKGFKRITTRNYPMLHQVCPQEIRALAEWLKERAPDSS